MNPKIIFAIIFSLMTASVSNGNKLRGQGLPNSSELEGISEHPEGIGKDTRDSEVNLQNHDTSMVKESDRALKKNKKEKKNKKDYDYDYDDYDYNDDYENDDSRNGKSGKTKDTRHWGGFLPP